MQNWKSVSGTGLWCHLDLDERLQATAAQRFQVHFKLHLTIYLWKQNNNKKLGKKRNKISQLFRVGLWKIKGRGCLMLFFGAQGHVYRLCDYYVRTLEKRTYAFVSVFNVLKLITFRRYIDFDASAKSTFYANTNTVTNHENKMVSRMWESHHHQHWLWNEFSKRVVCVWWEPDIDEKRR